MISRRFSLRFFYTGITVLLLGISVYVAGGRFNATHSIPFGLYWVTDRPVAKGEYVILCPPKTPLFDEARHRGYIRAGFCPGDYEYLMKRILAAKTDEVHIADDGVYVNGDLLPFSRPFDADPSGRPLPVVRTNYQLGDSDLLLMTDVSPTSFDSRYFGLIDRSQVVGVIRPILTW